MVAMKIQRIKLKSLSQNEEVKEIKIKIGKKKCIHVEKTNSSK